MGEDGGRHGVESVAGHGYEVDGDFTKMRVEGRDQGHQQAYMTLQTF